MRVRIYKDIEVGRAPLPGGFRVRLQDAADYLGVSDESLRRYIKAGRIASVEEDGTQGRTGWRHALTTDEVNRVQRIATVTRRLRFPDEWHRDAS